jgi:large subunit ribosomal protein L7/L12
MYVPLPVLAAAAILFLVLVFLAARRRRPAHDLIDPPRFSHLGPVAARPVAPTVDLPAHMLDEVRLLISQNRKIEAIKRVREATHLGLSEAKDLVERL